MVGMGQALSGVGNDGLAHKVLIAALALDRSALPPEPVAIARDLEAIGLNEYYAGRLDAAKPIIERALALRMQTEGAWGPSVSDNLNTLASISYEKGDTASAEKYWRRNLAFDEKVLGRDHPDLAVTINNLARVLIERRAFREARDMLDRAVSIITTEKGKSNEDLAYIYLNLGIAQQRLGQLGADETLQKALAIATAHKHRTLGLVLGEMADLRCAGPNPPSSTALLNRAERAIVSDYDQDDWRQSWIADVRAGCLAAMGQSKAASTLFAQSGPKLFNRWKPSSMFASDARTRRLRRI